MEQSRDFDSLFMERRSVRAWEDRPVSAEMEKRLLKTALRTPTAGNMMLYSILGIEDAELKMRLAETCDHQPFFARAPPIFVFLADYARMMAVFKASAGFTLEMRRSVSVMLRDWDE